MVSARVVWLLRVLCGCFLVSQCVAKKNLKPTAHVAVDIGSQFLKVSAEQSVRGHKKAMLLKNSQPIVTNAEGSRKTPSAVAFRDGSILYGVQALSSQARFPDQTFAHTNQMLGQTGQPSAGGPSWFKRHGFRYNWQDDKRGAARVAACCPEISLPAEVLSGLLLAHVDEMVSAKVAESGELESMHVALAVPPGWSARQREALLDAASIAALGGSSAQVELVNSHVAAAFKYAMNLRLLQSEPEDVTKAAHVALIVDAGSAYVSASVISVQAVRKGTGKKSSIVERLRVKGVAWTDDRDGLGAGRAIDEKIARHLAGIYADQLSANGETVTADSVWADSRVAMMLLQEGSKSKEVLSANTERQIVIEGLPKPSGGLEGSLRTKITREQLEDLSRQVIEGWVTVVRKAIAQSGLEDRIDAVTLIGGSARIPAFQAAVRQLVQKEKLESGGLDGDEAVVHGAVLYGLSRHEPAALGRSILLVEDELSTEATGSEKGKGDVPKALVGNARDAAEGQLQELRRVASVVAAVAAARDRLERFVFKIQEKAGQEQTPAGTTLLEETQKWLADDTSVGGADPTSEADYADKLSALELAFPDIAAEEKAPPPPPEKPKKKIPPVAMPKDEIGGEGLRLPRGLVIGDELVFSGYVPSKSKKPIGLFDVALTGISGYFVDDVALRFWVREDGDGDVPPARGISRLAKVGGEWTEDEGAADKERPSQFERGNAFQLRIVVGKDNYGISVGGADGAGASYRVKFAHKIPLDDVRMIVSRKVKWKKVELIASAPLCPPGKKLKEPCPKWAQGKINFLFN